jgi:L-lactate dehydrogenase complex protein LldG
MTESGKKAETRDNILRSIRAHLAASEIHEQNESLHVSQATTSVVENGSPATAVSNLELFKTNLEAVNGHCLIAKTETEIVSALTRIITELKQTILNPRRIALSDAPGLDSLVRLIPLQLEEVVVAPGAADVFNFDIGITTAQAAIAETGTLVLDSSQERHRLVSLVPPVHIAIIDAAKIVSTLGEALGVLHNDSNNLSSIVTFVTGPSRTADIELTLTIGVHGPKELYVIINEGDVMEVVIEGIGGLGSPKVVAE